MTAPIGLDGLVEGLEGQDGLYGLLRGGGGRGGAAGCRSLHGHEYEGDGSGEDEGSLHVVTVGKFKFLKGVVAFSTYKARSG